MYMTSPSQTHSTYDRAHARELTCDTGLGNTTTIKTTPLATISPRFRTINPTSRQLYNKKQATCKSRTHKKNISFPSSFHQVCNFLSIRNTKKTFPRKNPSAFHQLSISFPSTFYICRRLTILIYIYIYIYVF